MTALLFAPYGVASASSNGASSIGTDLSMFDKDQLVHQQIGQDHYYAVSPKDGSLLEVYAEEPYELYTAVPRRSSGYFTAGYEVSVISSNVTTMTAINIATTPTCFIDWVGMMNANLDFKSEEMLDIIQLSKSHDIFSVRALLCRSNERTIPGVKDYADKLFSMTVWENGNNVYTAPGPNGKQRRLFGFKTTYVSSFNHTGVSLGTNIAYELGISDDELNNREQRLRQQTGVLHPNTSFVDQLRIANSVVTERFEKRAMAMFFSGHFHQYGRLRSSRLLHSTRPLRFKWKE